MADIQDAVADGDRRGDDVVRVGGGANRDAAEGDAGIFVAAILARQRLRDRLAGAYGERGAAVPVRSQDEVAGMVIALKFRLATTVVPSLTVSVPKLDIAE